MIDDLYNIVIGSCLLVIAFLVYKVKKLNAMKKRFIDLLSEKDKEIDRLEKTLDKKKV